jgi:hypothetical protein
LVGLTPRLTTADEKIVVGPPALPNVNAKASIPVDVCLRASVVEDLLLTHGLLLVAASIASAQEGILYYSRPQTTTAN